MGGEPASLVSLSLALSLATHSGRSLICSPHLPQVLVIHATSGFTRPGSPCGGGTGGGCRPGSYCILGVPHPLPRAKQCSGLYSASQGSSSSLAPPTLKPALCGESSPAKLVPHPLWVQGVIVVMLSAMEGAWKKFPGLTGFSAALMALHFPLDRVLGAHRALHHVFMERGYNDSSYTFKFEKLANEMQCQRSH